MFDNGSQRLESRLVFLDDVFVAVLTHIGAEHSGARSGKWLLKVGCGPCETAAKEPPSFQDPQEASEWFAAIAARTGRFTDPAESGSFVSRG
ncbi:hypothetical protein DYI37_10155 [Fulvimarina endophytica]|uniref:Uncharacterized protein n=2 Tax=Fulvimarina endophytica TaxID=2293836 RepID=A0A371X2F0_9HYPH|nr:hypothetical protein DYI37_10155 [Fulvimarina endophytica]